LRASEEPSDGAAPPPVPRVRCLRCDRVLPVSELGAHRRSHSAHGPFPEDWTAARVDGLGSGPDDEPSPG